MFDILDECTPVEMMEMMDEYTDYQVYDDILDDMEINEFYIYTEASAGTDNAEIDDSDDNYYSDDEEDYNEYEEDDDI